MAFSSAVSRFTLPALLATSALCAFALASPAAYAHSSASVPSGHGMQAKMAGLVQKSAGASDSAAALPEFGANFSQFELDNGMQVVVIPDHRAPVVTHMVWYKVGAADEGAGKSGIAHFLEHLMFKGTKNHPDGEFSRLVASVGGQENAFTSQDYTAYYQRVAKEHLPLMMEMESDRMANLVLREDQVAPELKVVQEERLSRIDNNPSAQLGQAVSAALYRNNPYGIPVIGWKHEIEGLTLQDAIDFYNLYYTPNNAILIVAGDVKEADVRKLAEETYGKIARRAEPGERMRPSEPPLLTSQSVTLRHERVRTPTISRSYLVPSYSQAKKGEAEALDLLAYILGSGTNSRLYQSLVVKDKIATSAGAYYQSSGLDNVVFAFYGRPVPGKTLDDVEAAIDAEIAKILADGVTDEEITRAKRSMLADAFYSQDSQESLARIVGTTLTSGANLEDLRSWPQELNSATKDDILQAAKTYLDGKGSVTGYLLPKVEAKTVQAKADTKPAAKNMEQSKAKPHAKEVKKAKSSSIPLPQARPVGLPKPKPQAQLKPQAKQSSSVITTSISPKTS
ncbi:MAG: insulinase family protein [Cohaesibacter sp.]|jgi:zinc protease|nr:insulinase family protein [Cohaesibacter sp.]